MTRKSKVAMVEKIDYLKYKSIADVSLFKIQSDLPPKKESKY